MRENTLLPGKIYFNDKQSVFDCVVKNLSSGGAHLKVPSRLGIPNRFTLFVPSVDEKLDCWVVWGTMSEMGVTFTPPRMTEKKPDLQLVRN